MGGQLQVQVGSDKRGAAKLNAGIAHIAHFSSFN